MTRQTKEMIEVHQLQEVLESELKLQLDENDFR